MKLYLKIFFVMGLSSYIILMIMLPIMLPLVTPYLELSSIIGGFLIGIIVAAILGSMHLRSVRKLPLQDINDAYKVRHSQRIQLKKSFVESFELCIESAQSMVNYKILSSNEKKGRIVVKICKSKNSWGERIDFHIEELSSNSCSILVASKPIFFTAIIDCGRNFTNVNTIINYLKENAQFSEDS